MKKKEELCIYFSALTKNPPQWAPNTVYFILNEDKTSITGYVTSKTGEPKPITSDGVFVYEDLNTNTPLHIIGKMGVDFVNETVTSIESFGLQGEELVIVFNKEDGTQQTISTEISGIGGGELVKVTEGGKIGYGLKGVDPIVFGDTGTDAFNFGKSTTVSSTKGATGDRSVNFGLNNTTSGKNSLSIGNDNQNPYNDSIVVGSKFRGVSTNGYGTGNIFLADYTNTNLTVHNNIYSSLIGGSDSIIGTPGATLNQAIIYQSIINGWHNNIYAGESSLAVGHALLGGAARCTIVGVANIDLTSTIATQNTATRYAYNPRFIVGVGNWNSDTNTGTRANGFVVMSDGTASFPSLTNLMIDSSSGKSAVTKDWVLANSGGGGSAQNLQQVTDIGATTTNDMTISASNNTDTKFMKLEGTENSFFSIVSKGITNPVFDYGIKYKADRIVSRGSAAPYLVRGQYIFPDLGDNSTERYLPVSVNGEIADLSGNITIPTGGGGIPEAPTDGSLYGRQNSSWQEIVIPLDGVQSYTELDDATSVNLTTVNIPLKNALQAKEDSLGNPVTNDLVLSSTTSGVRSWVAQSGSGGGIAEAPLDGQTYARKNAAWESFVATGILDAPADGEIYARKDNSWVKVFEGLGFIASEFDITSNSSSIILTLSDSLDVGFIALNGEILRYSEWSQSGTSLTVTPVVALKDTDYISVFQLSPKGNNVGGGSGGGGTLLKDVQLIGNGVATTIIVNHGLGTEDISCVRVVDVATKEVIQTTEEMIDTNSFSLTFGTAPTTNQFKVITTA